jgi:hypothetical protein
MLSALIGIAAALVGAQSKIGTIGERPLTWDWLGVVPLECAQKPSADQAKLFEPMGRGDFYLAEPPARAHFRANPNDLVDAWIIFQCARHRRRVDELLSDSAEWLSKTPTVATRFLRLNALNLSFVVRIQNNPTHDPLNSLREEISRAETALRPDAAKNIAALTAVIGSLNSDVKQDRQLAKGLAESMPKSVEAEMLYVRCLLRGHYGVPFGKDAFGRPVQPSPQSKMVLLPPLEPKIDDALAELDRTEKRLGKHPLIDYYRAAAFAMKAYFFDIKKDDPAKLDALAVGSANRFLKSGADYPRLQACVQKFLSNHGFGAFFPWPDE